MWISLIILSLIVLVAVTFYENEQNKRKIIQAITAETDPVVKQMKTELYGKWMLETNFLKKSVLQMEIIGSLK